MNHVDEIRRSLAIERDALDVLVNRVGDREARAVDMLLGCKGRVIVAGLGKAGLVGQKLAATLSSTGSPAVFLHPVDALHGDLGVTMPGDIAMVISNSGESDEIVTLLRNLNRLGLPVIAITGNTRSTLARHSAVVLDAGVEKEADPLGLAPTASTTAAMALGDALAAALIKARSFSPENFAAFHPAGSLGNSLLAQVRDLMSSQENTPRVSPNSQVRDAILEISSKRFGATMVIGPDAQLQGIVTDGDLRRHFEKHPNPLEASVEEAMTNSPRTVSESARAIDALQIMEEHSITIMPVIDENDRPVAVIHLHDLLRSGLSIWAEE
jgi:arabinose-5-phosphate isomerase